MGHFPWVTRPFKWQKSLRRNFCKSKIQNRRQSNSKFWWRHTKILTGQLTSSPLEATANELFNGNTTALANEINSTFQSVSSDLSPLKVNDLLCSACSKQLYNTC